MIILLYNFFFQIHYEPTTNIIEGGTHKYHKSKDITIIRMNIITDLITNVLKIFVLWKKEKYQQTTKHWYILKKIIVINKIQITYYFYKLCYIFSILNVTLIIIIIIKVILQVYNIVRFSFIDLSNPPKMPKKFMAGWYYARDLMGTVDKCRRLTVDTWRINSGLRALAFFDDTVIASRPFDGLLPLDDEDHDLLFLSVMRAERERAERLHKSGKLGCKQ